MASFFIDIDENYQPEDPTQVISVEVAIGNGQSGAYLVFLDNKFIGANRKLQLGTGSGIKGMKSLLSVTITDELEETNWTSCTVNLYEGTKLTTTLGPFKKLVPAQNDTVIYSISIYHE